MHVFTVSAVCNKIVVVYLCACLRVFERKSRQLKPIFTHFFYLCHSEYKEIILKF